jgi:hypothetical protein
MHLYAVTGGEPTSEKHIIMMGIKTSQRQT